MTEFGRRWVDRRLHRVAYQLSAGQFEALRRAPLDRRTAGVARVVTLAAAALMLLGVLGLVVLGGWLVAYDFPDVTIVLGLIALGLAYVLRPRLGRMSDLGDDVQVLDPASAPALYALAERVAAEIGAPAPQTIALGPGFGAFTTTVGVRRRRVLCLGAPLWATLGPPERLALLGHQLGHFVNGDLRRGPFTQMAETTLGKLADVFNPAADARRGGGFLEMITAAVVSGVLWLLTRPILGAQLVLLWVSQRDSQRAEYRADELAARTAGTPAAVRLLDRMLIVDAIDTVVRREARAGEGAAAWRAAAEQACRNRAAALPGLRARSGRDDVSLFASHPPAGLRAAMLELRPTQPAAVTLTAADSDRIDAELTEPYERVRRDLAYS